MTHQFSFRIAFYSEGHAHMKAINKVENKSAILRNLKTILISYNYRIIIGIIFY